MTRPFPLAGYIFTRNGGEIVEDGKSYWPDCISIEIDRREALQIMARLANFLLYQDDNTSLSWCGKLERDEDEEETE